MARATQEARGWRRKRVRRGGSAPIELAQGATPMTNGAVKKRPIVKSPPTHKT